MEPSGEVQSQRSTLLELLARLISHLTPAGQGHLILSEAELEAWLVRELPNQVDDDLPASAVRLMRNELAHSVFVTKNYDSLFKFLEREHDLAFPDLNARITRDRLFALATRALQRAPDEAWLDTVTLIASNFLLFLLADNDILEKISDDEAIRLARSAAENILASARWSRVVGDRLDTTAVTNLLGITRQALAKRQAAGSLIGLPGHGTTWYPTWQFDQETGQVRPEVRGIIGAFRDRLDDFDPLLVASWATTTQDEDLDGMTPEQWIRLGRDSHHVRVSAERAAGRMAR